MAASKREIEVTRNGVTEMWTLEIFDSFEEADLSTKRDDWAMTPLQRLQIVEHLRQSIWGPHGKQGTARRLQGPVEVLKQPWS